MLLEGNTHMKTPAEAIISFTGKYRFLSNFHMCYIRWGGGNLYPSVENAYQAAKTMDMNERIKFLNIYPGAAKKLGRTLKLRENWEDVKVGTMLVLLAIKFSEPKLRAKLLATGDAKLVEGNDWGDTYWGVCNGEGHNMLGKLLVELRKTIINKSNEKLNSAVASDRHKRPCAARAANGRFYDQRLLIDDADDDEPILAIDELID